MKKLICFILLTIAIVGCKEKYDSPVVSPTSGYLVVEGTINVGNVTTEIVLKRTVKLDNPVIIYESGALVSVLGEDNSIYPLNENGTGHYKGSNLTLNKAKKYKLHIQTKDSKVYESDYVEIRNTPAIDSVSKKYNSTGLELYVSTHDATGSTKYYQWDYTETWEYHSPYKQYLSYQQLPPPNINKYTLVYFDPALISFNSAIFTCWPTENSSAIISGSTVTLSDNKIFLPITFITKGSVKLSQLYSINTRQYSLSEGRYNYLQKMKKNTEGTGSVFDAQPSELVGNIHCTTNATEPVIGYIDICNIQEKRIFINNSELPDWNYLAPCLQTEVKNSVDSISFVHDRFLPTDVAKYSPTGLAVLSYFFSTPACVDCTIWGTNKKPSYWP
ncbi:MAG: DUF4249 domain-containing protein [Bacteroidetes bacterium]|nr:DUF4249 domain-containing protein [Bacteroidota bacterium]